jgi:hypothetical protein
MGRPGAKRVANYMKRADDGAAARRLLSREELELLDVARGMEEQLLEQYKQVRGAVHLVMLNTRVVKHLLHMLRRDWGLRLGCMSCCGLWAPRVSLSKLR